MTKKIIINMFIVMNVRTVLDPGRSPRDRQRGGHTVAEKALQYEGIEGC
jgi:hypothetical protein